jgi:hypothetical protein
MQRQAQAPKTQPFGAEAFEAGDGTVLRWLGMAGFLINSRGTTVMVDPLLGGFDMPVIIEFPIDAADVPKLDAVLVTHSDNDHYSIPTCRDLAGVTGEYHSTQFVASLMQQESLPAYGHDIGEHFAIGPVPVKVTPADHAWQNASPGASDRIFEPEDCCGFWLETPDGTIWAPGDSRLIPDHHLRMPTADAMCLTSLTASGTSGSTARSRWRMPIRARRCCCTTGAAWTLLISHRSTPIRIVAGPGREPGTHLRPGARRALRAAKTDKLINTNPLIWSGRAVRDGSAAC